MSYFVGVYWGARAESRSQCAIRLERFFSELFEANVGFSDWYQKISSKRKSPVRLPQSADELECFLKGNFRDVGGEFISELGFNFSAWTGPHTKDNAAFGATLGASGSAIRNSVVISFDSQVEPPRQHLQKILQIAVDSFDPDVGVVCTVDELAAHPNLEAWEVPSLCRYKRN